MKGFTELPQNIQDDLFNHHTHGELCHPDEIVYREATVVRILHEQLEKIERLEHLLSVWDIDIATGEKLKH